MMREHWLCLKCGRPYGSPYRSTCRQGCGCGSCALQVRRPEGLAVGEQVQLLGGAR